MPFYEYQCLSCEHTFEKMLSMSRCDEAIPCASCGEPTRQIISAPELSFVGDDWASKNDRIARQMTKKRENQSKRQEEKKREAPGVQLVPNVDGERVGSWSEAQKLAASKGKDTASYGPKIQAERKV